MRLSILLLSILLLGTACMSWTPGWHSPPAPDSFRAASVPSTTEADDLFASADDRASLARTIAAYESILANGAGADSTQLHTKLAEANIVYGAAYASGRSEKAVYYRRGLQHAEQAMSTDPRFLERVEAGDSVAEASAVLGPDEAQAMLLWVTGVSYYFREALTPVWKSGEFSDDIADGADSRAPHDHHSRSSETGLFPSHSRSTTSRVPPGPDGTSSGPPSCSSRRSRSLPALS